LNFGTVPTVLVRNNMDVNGHERPFNVTLRRKFK
jgi:hypothetical protein